jgi:hypothetical protein
VGGLRGGLRGGVRGGGRGGVLGAVASVGHHAIRGSLPFTGFPIWAALLIGLGLIGSGLALRRYARATV